eukprot:scaffold430_cov73-Skeletonema_marinoi.AAC.7
MVSRKKAKAKGKARKAAQAKVEEQKENPSTSTAASPSRQRGQEGSRGIHYFKLLKTRSIMRLQKLLEINSSDDHTLVSFLESALLVPA